MLLMIFFLFVLLGIALLARTDTILEFELNPKLSVVHACDYSNPLTSLPFVSSSMPCSGIYTNSGAMNDFKYTFNSSYIESINELKTIKAKKCFKLELTTWCKQHWALPNEDGRESKTLTVTRDECFSSTTCFNCEVESQYPLKNCEVFTWGRSDVKVTKVFSSDVIVFQNVIGDSSYGGMTTKEEYFLLGGNYDERVFFQKLPTAPPKVGKFIINPSNQDLLSYDLRRLMSVTNSTYEFASDVWVLYDNDHLVLKSPITDILARIQADNATRLLRKCKICSPKAAKQESYKVLLTQA
jgi:hypothetical protein